MEEEIKQRRILAFERFKSCENPEKICQMWPSSFPFQVRSDDSWRILGCMEADGNSRTNVVATIDVKEQKLKLFLDKSRSRNSITNCDKSVECQRCPGTQQLIHT